MFEELARKLQSLAEGRKRCAPPTLDDPLAKRTSWDPLEGGGTNFCTHKLVIPVPGRVEFRASLAALIFYGAFFVIGLGALILGLAIAISKGEFSFKQLEVIIPVLMGAVFMALGACLCYLGTAPIVFDKDIGAFWKGRRSPHQVLDTAVLKYYAKLEDIHALQLLSGYVRSNKRGHYSYELNLVLTDGERVNAIQHGNLKRIREDTEALSEFLRKPVWDAT